MEVTRTVCVVVCVVVVTQYIWLIGHHALIRYHVNSMCLLEHNKLEVELLHMLDKYCHFVFTTTTNNNNVCRFHAEKRRGCQAFQLVEPEWVRYVAIRFLSQHTNELICAVSEVGVYGKTATQDLEDQLISSNGDTEEQAAEAVPTKDGTLDTASTEVDAAADAVAKHVASVDGTTETERNMTPQHDAPAPEADAKRPPAPMPKAVPVIGTDAPRMKPPPLASVPPRSAPDGGSARPEAKGEVGKEAPLPSGGSSRPSSMYDRLIQQLKEMKVQQARLQAAHEELLESTAARIDALVQAQAALTEQLKQVQGMLGDVKPARKGSTFAGWWSVANDD